MWTVFPPGLSGRARGVVLSAAVALLCLVVGAAAYHLALQAALEKDHQRTTQRVAFYAQTLEAGLARYETLPGLLALERDLLAVLREPNDAAHRHAANVYLEAAGHWSGVTAAYLMDAQGHTVAASNWREPNSFVGQNYAFRPYFRAALEGQTGRFYAIGATTGEPGYFLAGPLKHEGKVVGVVAIKVALEGFEAALHGSGDTVLLADPLGVVFIASNPAWRYRSLAPLQAQQREELERTRQYGKHLPQPLFAGAGLTAEQATVVLTDNRAPHWRWEAHAIGPLRWQLVLLRDPRPLQQEAVVVAAATALALGLAAALGAIALLRRHRRQELQQLHASLERRIAERTADLSRQVQALERTETILRQTQDSAVQAGKLAVLGQMAAGMTHELNQPLAALHAYADNARALLARGDVPAVRDNLESISHLAGRLGRLVGQLKAFARKEPLERTRVVLGAALNNALLIVEPRRKELGAAIDTRGVAAQVFVLAQTVRLEQVLVNLLRNALDAAAKAEPALVQVAAREHGGQVLIEVMDNGGGIDANAAAHLFEPFFTTKDAGTGLGLGLAISQAIVEGFGGRMEACNRAQGGAVFSLWLHACPDSATLPHESPLHA